MSWPSRRSLVNIAACFDRRSSAVCGVRAHRFVGDRWCSGTGVSGGHSGAGGEVAGVWCGVDDHHARGHCGVARVTQARRCTLASAQPRRPVTRSYSFPRTGNEARGRRFFTFTCDLSSWFQAAAGRSNARAGGFGGVDLAGADADSIGVAGIALPGSLRCRFHTRHAVDVRLDRTALRAQRATNIEALTLDCKHWRAR